jgi:hypothetical protein
MDETQMCFDMPSRATIDVRKKKEVLIHGTGAHKCHFTVMLVLLQGKCFNLLLL